MEERGAKYPCDNVADHCMLLCSCSGGLDDEGPVFTSI